MRVCRFQNAERSGCPCHPLQQWDDRPASYIQKLAVKIQPGCMHRCFDGIPIQGRAVACRRGVWVSQTLQRVRVGKLGQMAELLAAPVTHLVGEGRRIVTEEVERPGRAPLLPHEKHRDARCQQQNGGAKANCRRRGQRRQPLAERRVADLVVVLQEVDESRWRQMGRRCSAVQAWAMRRFVTLIGKAFRQRQPEPSKWRVRVIDIVAVTALGHEHAHDMVKVVVPLCLVLCSLSLRQPSRVVVVVLQGKVNDTARRRGTQAAREFVQDVLGAVVEYGLHRVQPEPIHMELLDPVDGVLDEEFPHGLRVRTVEVDGAAPWRVVPVGKELRRVVQDVVRSRAEMVVDDIEHDRDATLVALVDQTLEVVGPTVVMMRRVRQHPVIPPVAGARECSHRHQLDHRHAERRKMVQMTDRPEKGSLLGKRADMQFVQHGLRPGPSRPVCVGPAVCLGGAQFGPTVSALGLAARGRVGDQRAVAGEAVTAGRGQWNAGGVPAFGRGLHGDRDTAFDDDFDMLDRRCPETDRHCLGPRLCTPRWVGGGIICRGGNCHL